MSTSAGAKVQGINMMIPAEVLRKSGPCSSLTSGVDGKSQEQRQQVARRAPRVHQ